MKKVSVFLLSLLTIVSVQAQQSMSAVTITVTGNKNLQVTIDGSNYIANSTTSANKTTIVINQLSTGQHTFLVTRTDLNTNRSVQVSSLFNLRNRYDMWINLNENGSLELIEKKKAGIAEGQAPISNSNFSILLKSVRNQRSATGKRSVITNAFTNTGNYFTTTQVRQLIQLINSESDRLQLAKLSYLVITDQGNFYWLYDLLKSQASRNELEEYVLNYDEGVSTGLPMTGASFNALYQDIKNQWPVGTQMISLANAFNNTNNYFSTSQAKQLIQLVSTESNRLQLAKLSYRSITDRFNFSQVYTLFNYQSSKDELAAYVNSYNTGAGNINQPMPDSRFNELYQDIKNQWPVSTQFNSLTSAFNNTSNYFTTYQASQLIQLITGESNRLQLAKLSYRSITDRNNFSQLYNLLNYQSSKDELAAYVNNYNSGVDNSHLPMPDASFNALYQDIKNQWPVSTQFNSLTSAFNNTANYFTTYQASQLIQLIIGESNRLQLAKLSYRSITDRNNFSQLYNLLNYQSSKDELAAYVNSYNTGVDNIHPPMPDASFNALYQDIKNQWPVSTQFNSLTSAFNNTANYFTTYQASQLIQLIIGESNRLQLAKLSYRSITDRNNFSQLSNLLSYQSSKDELAAYVTNYNSGGGVVNAVMSDAAFNALYQDLQMQFLPGEKMSSLTNEFNKPNNYFTSAQAKKLIQLVSLENNRLVLAKLSYRTIIDRNNFSQLYDLLNSEASRNELQAYVNAYRD